MSPNRHQQPTIATNGNLRTWLSAAAHLLAMFTLAQDGAFAPDGIIATLTPLTTVLWILALAATLPRSWLARRTDQHHPVATPGS